MDFVADQSDGFLPLLTTRIKTMTVLFLEDHDGYKAGETATVSFKMAIIYQASGVAIRV